jgi:hypothetical protein
MLGSGRKAARLKCIAGPEALVVHWWLLVVLDAD